MMEMCEQCELARGPCVLGGDAYDLQPFIG